MRVAIFAPSVVISTPSVVIARFNRAIYRVVRQEVDHGRECGIVLAGQGDRCAAASPALTGCARRRIGWP